MFWLYWFAPRIPLAWLMIVDPNCALSPRKEKDANPPQRVILELNLELASTSRLFLILVVPPWPPTLISDALVAKSSVWVFPVKNLTIPASVPRVTMFSGLVLSPPRTLLAPKVTSPAKLTLLLPNVVKELEDVVLAPSLPSSKKKKLRPRPPRVPVRRACSHYRLDMSADYGLCKCGFPKNEHKNNTTYYYHK